MNQPNNVFAQLPDASGEEVFELLASSSDCKIERIVSQGQSTPPGQWYDQPRAEWVMLVQGAAMLEYQDGGQCSLKPGDHTTLPAHCKHRVAWTHPTETTIWIAVHF